MRQGAVHAIFRAPIQSATLSVLCTMRTRGRRMDDRRQTRGLRPVKAVMERRADTRVEQRRTIGVFAVAGTGAARLRRNSRAAADRNLRLRCRRADPAVQPARRGAVGPPAGAGPDPRPVHRAVPVFRRRRRGAAALQARRGAADRPADPRRGGDGRAHRRQSRSSCCSTSIRCSIRRASSSAPSTASRTSPSASA